MQGYRDTLGYNHEGYLDMTAYKALSNIYKGDRKMTGWSNGDIIKLRLPNAEYVFRIIVRAHDRYATTLNLYEKKSVENGYTVRVEGDKKLHADLGRLTYTKNWDLDDCQFVRALTEEELEKLLARIGDTLGIPRLSVPGGEDGTDYQSQCAGLREEVDAIFAEKKKLEQDYEAMRADMDSLASKNAELAAQNRELEARASAQDPGELEKKEEELHRVRAELEILRESLETAVKENSESKALIIRAETERDVYKDLYRQILVKYDL